MPRKAANAPADGLDLSGLSQPTTYQDANRPVADEIIQWVEDSYKHWQENPTRWRTVVLGSEQAVAAALSEGRRYCTKVRETPLSLQVKMAGTDGNKLTYRVREAIRRGTSDND